MIALLKDNEITDNTPLGGDIDVDRLRQCLIDAQATRLEEILGEVLYAKIETDYANETLTGDYFILYDGYIKPFLYSQTAVEFLKIGAVSIGNNGIVVPAPTNTQPISETMLGGLIRDAKNKADMYASRMVRWLCLNKLPEYNSNSNNVINPTKPSSGNWYFNNKKLTEDEWVTKKLLQNRN